MITFLLIIIYIAFISLGIPDSLFGTAWPEIYTEFKLPISFANFITITTAAGTIISSLLSSKIIHRFGTNKVSAFSTFLTAAALFFISCTQNPLFFILFSLPLGMGAGAIDTALNNYVALYYSASQMSFLHCFYGIGVSLSPYVLSRVINSNLGWRGGYRIAFLIQISIAILLFLTLPLWHRAHPQHMSVFTTSDSTLSFRECLKIKGVREMCLLFITSCGIEYTCGNWGSTFLVEYKHMNTDTAAQAIMFYYIGITLGRVFSGILAIHLHSWKIVRISQVILCLSIILFLLPSAHAASVIGLFLVGLGNGPLFPNFNYLTPENFGNENSQSIIGIQMAASYIGIMVLPAIFGFLCQLIGLGIFPIYLLTLFIIMLIFTYKVKKILKSS